MSTRFHVNPFDLLGQNELYPRAVFLPGKIQPKLEIAWNSFHQNFFSGLPVLFQRARSPQDAAAPDVFRDCRVERRIPRRALIAAGLWHVVFFMFPWSLLPAASRRNPAFENTELTWSGPIDDLPLLSIPKENVKSIRKSQPDHPPSAEGADAFHPRQRIFTDAVHPTHPRQTLINSAAPPDAPKFLPDLPNIVQLGSTQAPARPRIQISEQTLAKLRPREVKRVATTDTPTAELPNLEQRPAEISLVAAVGGPAKPKLEINAGSAPRLADRAQNGEVVSAPDFSTSVPGEAGGDSPTLIALSASPAPPAPVVTIPQGNLAARVAISPEGEKPGVPGGTPNGAAGGGGGAEEGSSLGGGKSAVGISISGGSPKPNVGISGLGSVGKLSVPKLRLDLKRPDPNAAVEDPPERVGPPNFAALPPGAKPEQIFSSRRVYSMNINMPNLNSATGSWIIHFSELHHSGGGRAADVSAPVPVRKIDPKYPQTLVQDHVEGEVVLYGVIRQDGSVDAIQVVRRVDEQLDANAVNAFKGWKFEPARKDGQAVDVEAIVHIPFRAPERK